MSIDWSLIGQPVDLSARFREGYHHSQEANRQRRMEGALAAFSSDPSNPAAQSALASLSPDFALYMGKHKLDTALEAEKRTRIGKYVVDGDFGGGAARAAAAGDIDVADTLLKLDKPQKDRLQGMYKSAAPIAYQALKLPYEQRKQYIASATPELKANGWSDEQLSQFDPTDEALHAVVDSNLTLEQHMGRDEIKWHQAGEQPSFATDAMGHPVGAGNPYAGTSGGGHPPVLTDDDIRAMDGGQTGAPSGNFP